MKLNKKKILGILSALIILALLFFLLKNSHEDIERIKNIPTSILATVIILTLVEFYLNGVMLKVLLQQFNIHTKIKEWLGLSAITTLGNYLTFFRGGTTAKAVYLKKNHDLSYPHFLASVGASYVITVFVYGLIGMFFSIIMLSYQHLFHLELFFLFVALFIVSLIFIFFSPRFPETEKRFLKHIYTILNGWHTLRKNKLFVLKFSLLVFILYAVSASKIYLLYKALSYDIQPISAAFITLLSSLSIFLSVTPAGLGVREAVVAITSNILDLGLKSGLYVASLERAITIILISIIGPIFSYMLIKKTTQTS